MARDVRRSGAICAPRGRFRVEQAIAIKFARIERCRLDALLCKGLWFYAVGTGEGR